MTEEKIIENKITKDMKIGEVAQKFPKAIHILIEKGIHCIGCAAAHFENLEEGLTAHGKSEKEITEIIEEMNNVISKE